MRPYRERKNFILEYRKYYLKEPVKKQIKAQLHFLNSSKNLTEKKQHPQEKWDDF